jgi:hypothetical protein
MDGFAFTHVIKVYNCNPASTGLLLLNVGLFGGIRYYAPNSDVAVGLRGVK